MGGESRPCPPEDSEPVGGLVVLGQAAHAGERGGTDGVRLAVGVDVLQGLGGGQDTSLVQRVLDGVYTQPRSPTRPVLTSLLFAWSIVLMNSAKYVANVSGCSMIRP